MLSILIPTYNERANIAPLVRSIEGALKSEHEIIIIDDGSPDGTSEEVLRLAKEVPCLRLVHRKGRQGLTSAIVDGLRASKGDRIAVMDADLSHPSSLLPQMESGLKDHDIVVGSRRMKGGGVETWPFHRKLISGGAHLLAAIFVRPRCSDPLSGFFAARRVIMLKTRFRTKGYKLLLNILADNRDAHVAELPYMFKDRAWGQTKLGSLEILNFIADLLRIDFG